MSIPIEPTTAFFPAQRVILSSGPIAYRQAGSGDALLLIHGWRGSSRYWMDTLEHFSDTRSVYAVDLPGHGESPPLVGESSAARLARLIIEFAETAGLERFDLIGHSLGAAIAVHVAAHQPERVRRLVLTSLGTFRNAFEYFIFSQAYFQWSLGLQLWRPWLETWRPWLALYDSWITWLGSQPAVYKTLAGNFVYQLPFDEEMIRDGVLEFLRTDQINALDSAISAGSPIFPALARKITAPTLVVSANQDPIMPPSGVRALADLLPNSQIILIDQCGHLPMIEQPQVYHQHVRAFLHDAG